MAVQNTTEGAKGARVSVTASHIISPALPVEHQAKELSESEFKGREPPALTVSRSLWNTAYNKLAEDEDTAELVKAYIKTLMVALDIDPSTDLSAKLKDPINGQIYMKELVKKGREKISTSRLSKITQGVGEMTQFILSVRPTIDAALQNNPQATLPWAGVCVGLQVKSAPVKAWFSLLISVSRSF